jgi:hypothetical protein
VGGGGRRSITKNNTEENGNKKISHSILSNYTCFNKDTYNSAGSAKTFLN